jgi:hypothetical protein
MKVSFKFLNRWENSLFEGCQREEAEVAPASAFMANTVLVAAFAMDITGFVMVAFYRTESLSDLAIAAAIIFSIPLLIVVIRACRNLLALSSAGAKVGYAAYMLAMFAVCTVLFTYLCGIVLMLIVLWAFIKVMLQSIFGDDRKHKRTIKVRTETPNESGGVNIREEEAEETERGLLGERYYRGKDSGRTYSDQDF